MSSPLVNTLRRMKRQQRTRESDPGSTLMSPRLRDEGDFTDEEYNKLKRKVDFILLPLVCRSAIAELISVDVVDVWYPADW